ncbi:hypothetical protein SDC9_212622 [bioreactor metagenome]|uniref:Uncharacterized protein n=1 Tax=bioreactor metagenome TaxID=1076179 RepID=A0A645JZP6_9ZZZZ
MDFYSIQDGMSFSGKKIGVAFSCPDTPMIWLGALSANHTVYENQPDHNRQQLYSWVMNNYWDTNFKASLGGFYEFNYHFSSGPELISPQKAIQCCKQMNSGAVVFRSSSQK